MSLINDALRRASQSDKNRPPRQATPLGMQPAPAAQSSRVTAILIGTVVITLILAGWFFWQWFNARNHRAGAYREPNLFPTVELRVSPPPAAQPKPAAMVAVAPEPPAAVPAKPAVMPAPPVVAPTAPAAVAPPAPPAVTAPVAAKDAPVIWPPDLKLTAIFFSRTNPRILVNGKMYGIGDQFEGVTVKKIENNQVTLESRGQTKTLVLEGQ